MKINFRILSLNDNHQENENNSKTMKNLNENNDINLENQIEKIIKQKNKNHFNFNLNNEPMDIVTDCDTINNNHYTDSDIEINLDNNNDDNIENKNNYTKDTINNNLEKIIKIKLSSTDHNYTECEDVNDYQSNLINRNTNKDTRMDIVKECNLVESSQRNKMRIALGVLIRLVLPLCNGVARGLRGIRGVRLLKILTNLGASRHMLTNMLAYAANTVSLSLSSVQVVHRIDPILKIMKLKKGSNNTKCLTSPPSTTSSSTSSPSLSSLKYRIPTINPAKSITLKSSNVSEVAEKCVTLNILAEPPPGQPIRADIIFIHGLHGSLVNTWKQGLWNSEGRKEEFKRPPKPPLRPPKRPRHSRSSIIIPPHVKKRPRYGESNDGDSVYDSYDSDSSDQKVPDMKTRHFSYDYGQPGTIDFYNDVEFSFPTFRLRREDSTSSTSSTTSSASSTPIPEFTSQNTKSDTTKTGCIQTDSYSKCWPGDWLPLDCPGVRVMALNYTTDPYLWRPIWVRKRNRTSLTERAREMTDMLIEKRVGHGHPIVWVGHSKGGIFIKQIIVDAWESGRLAAAPLWRSSRGVFFYSVPHRGSALADFNLPLLRRSVELTEIQKNSPSILDLHRRFVALYHSGNLKIDVFSFVETALTLMSVLYLRIVGVDSADPGIGEVCGVHLDHREICKPRSRNCILYTELVKMINRIS